MKDIDSILLTDFYHIFYKNKELKPLGQKTLSKVEKAIKKNVIPPKTNKKVYIIRLKLNSKSNPKLILTCSQFSINTKLKLSKGFDDDSVVITYSEDELNKYKFNLSQINKIIEKLKKDELDISKQFISISEILK